MNEDSSTAGAGGAAGPSCDLAVWMLGHCPLQPGDSPAAEAERGGDTAPPIDHGMRRYRVPADLLEQFDQSEWIEVTWDESDPQAWSAAPGGRLFNWLTEHLRHHPLNLVPRDRVASVHRLTPLLFTYFEVRQGSLQLGGCRLEDRPLLRRTTLDAQGRQQHHFFSRQNEPLPAALLKSLGVDQLRPAQQLTSPPLLEEDVTAWAGQSPVDGRVVLDVVVWCKYVTGELTAMSESGSSVYLPFSGWAGELISGRLKPPPYREPSTGDESYELVQLDDGALTASTAAERCSASGRLALRTALRTCAASGRRALEAFMAKCPVTGDWVVEDELRPCQQCRQVVGPHCRDANGVCQACRALKPAGPGDPELSRILGEHPGLGVWHRWRIAETRDVYILGASALMRRLLLVLDKQSLAPQHVAVRSRFSSVWTTPSDLEQQELLRG